MTDLILAPELDVEDWVGDAHTLEGLRGTVVMIEAFQMLCPGCVSHGIPLAQKVQAAFPDVQVLGLHTVFEHHEANSMAALKAFMHEYRITFPVGWDRHEGADPIPVTMRTYGLQGTPSTLLIDRQGQLRQSAFGQVDELRLGAQLGALLTQE